MTSIHQSVAILYSGGTDSTLVAALEQEHYQKIYLLSYYRRGIKGIENSKRHVEKLRAKFPDKEFIHLIESVEDLFVAVSYRNYFSNLFKHRFFLLSTCGFCKLAMHLKTIELCLKLKIEKVCDGAHHSMDIYPFQRQELLAELKNFYRSYGLDYYNPVFDMPETPQPSFFDFKIAPLLGNGNETVSGVKTISQQLFELGMIDRPGIRGSDYDKQNQAMCMQLLLFRLFALGFYIPLFGMKSYLDKTMKLFKQKMEESRDLILPRKDS